MKAQRGSKV